MTADEWINRCAARFVDRYKFSDDEARDLAEVCFYGFDFDLTQDPEDAADEEMSYWD